MADSTTPGASSGQPSAELVGKKIGRYVVESLIGHGGMGDVYVATDPLLHRRVALKRIHRSAEGGDGERQRVLREARRASKINDPRIAAVHDVLELDNEVIIVLEHVEGRTLRAVIADRPSVDDFWSIAEECTRALSVAHRAGLLHRDIKPENIMMTEAGAIKVLDFGLSKPLTQDRSLESITTESLQDSKLAGTPPYMAPESHLGREIDERADIFSLGVTFYELLTGIRPFTGATVQALAQEILNAEPTPPTELNSHVPPALSAVVLRMLAKAPADRYPTADDVLRDLEKARSGGSIPLPRPRRLPKVHAGPSNRIYAAVAALGLVVVVILARGGLEQIREYFGWFPLPSHKNVVLLPFEAEGDDENLAAMALGAASVLGSGLGKLSRDPSLQVAPFMETLRLGVDGPVHGLELQGANLVIRSVVSADRHTIRATLTLVDPILGRQLRSRSVETPRARPHEFLNETFVETSAMLGLPTDNLEPSKLLAYGTEGAGTLQSYFEGLGQTLSVLRGKDSVSAADTTTLLRAVASFERAARIDPDHAPSLSGMAHACRQMYRATQDTAWLDRGESAVRRAISLQDGLADAHKRLAFILWERGDRRFAADEMAKAVALDPLDDVALGNLGSYYRESGRPEEEERVYREAADARPHHWFPRWCLAIRVYYEQGRLDEAQSALEQVITRAPHLYKGYQALGGIQVLQGHYEAAAGSLEKSNAIRPNAEALGNLGVAYFNLRQFDKCIQTFNEVFQHKSGNYEDWLNLGDAYYWAPERRQNAAKAYSECIRLGRNALRRDPTNATILANLAQVYPKVGRPDSAAICIQASMANERENPMIQYCAAITYWQLEQKDHAIEWLERSVVGGYPVSWLRDSPVFDEWRSNDRFQQILHASQDDN